MKSDSDTSVAHEIATVGSTALSKLLRLARCPFALDIQRSGLPGMYKKQPMLVTTEQQPCRCRVKLYNCLYSVFWQLLGRHQKSSSHMSIQPGAV